MEETRKIITPLSVQRHSGRFWKPYTCYDFAAKKQFASLTAAELSMAVQTLPLCFTRWQDRFFLSALLSLVENENHFVNPDGRWAGIYVPACFRGHPFYVGKVPESDNKLIFCVDEACGLISDREGVAFFAEDGQPSPEVVKIFDFLKKIENNRVDTQRGVDALAETGTIVEWPFKVKTESGDIELEGLYRFDEEKFAGLDDEVVLKLRRTPAIAIGYGQLYSMVNVRVLVHLANVRKKQISPEPPPELNLENMFDEDDFIRF